jgi:hypothetical protein
MVPGEGDMRGEMAVTNFQFEPKGQIRIEGLGTGGFYVYIIGLHGSVSYVLTKEQLRALGEAIMKEVGEK